MFLRLKSCAGLRAGFFIRLSEKFMGPPGNAKLDCMIAADIHQHGSRQRPGGLISWHTAFDPSNDATPDIE
jgi:hypothetical protein